MLGANEKYRNCTVGLAWGGGGMWGVQTYKRFLCEDLLSSVVSHNGKPCLFAMDGF